MDRALRINRLRALSLRSRLAFGAGLLASLAGLVLMGDVLLRPAIVEGLSRRIEQWSFWCATATALVFGYTSFEVLYRDAGALRIARLPVERSGLFWLKVMRVYRVHLPLLVIPVASGASLLWSGQAVAYALAFANCVGVLIWGLAVAIWVHMRAGESLLEGESLFKGLLAGNVAPSETAFLFYSPAGALTAALCIGLFSDMGLATGADKGIWGPFYTLAALFTVAAIWSLYQAHTIYVRDQHRIAPRFADAEILPPWREGELPRRYLGEGLVVALPVSAQPLWRRDLLMYRRRFRVMGPLMVLVCVALVIYTVMTADAQGGPLRVSLVAIALGGLILTPVFRVAGPELGTRYDARALPVCSSDERRVQWLLAACEWTPLIVSATAASLIAGYGVATVAVASAVIAGFVCTNAVAIPMALRAAPHVGMVAVVVRGGLLLVLGGMSIAARAMGL